MIGAQGYYEALEGHFSGIGLNAVPSLGIDAREQVRPVGPGSCAIHRILEV
jgi:hypothetical protein